MLLNRARAADYMREYGLDVLVATSPVNITYFTDYYCWTDRLFKEFMMAPGAPAHLAQAYAVLPLEGEPALVVNPLLAVNAADLWVTDLHIFGGAGIDDSLPLGELPQPLRRLEALLRAEHDNAGPTDALLNILRQRGLTNARIGLEMEGLPPATNDQIRRALPGASLKDCADLIRMVRMVKSAEEIHLLTRSAEINEQAAMDSLAIARPGHPISELVEHYRSHAASQGADFDHYAFGVHGLGIATETNHRLTAGDVLYVDFGCIYRQCFSDTGTTLAMRELPDELNMRHAALHACIEAGEEALRPGAKASDIADAMNQALHDRNITGSFPHGHGVGLEVRDYPILVPDNGLRIQDDCVDLPSDLVLETDMVLNLEAPLFMPGVGSLHIERSYVVTSHGSRPLIEQHRRLPVIIDPS